MVARAFGTGMAAVCLLACAHPAGDTTMARTSSQEPGAASAPHATTAEPTARMIRITAHKWSFTPDEIHLVVGQPVVLELVSLDPGRSIQIPVRPLRAGTFTFHCDVFCGDGHEEMSGRIVVAPAP